MGTETPQPPYTSFPNSLLTYYQHIAPLSPDNHALPKKRIITHTRDGGMRINLSKGVPED